MRDVGSKRNSKSGEVNLWIVILRTQYAVTRAGFFYQVAGGAWVAIWNPGTAGAGAWSALTLIARAVAREAPSCSVSSRRRRHHLHRRRRRRRRCSACGRFKIIWLLLGYPSHLPSPRRLFRGEPDCIRLVAASELEKDAYAWLLAG